MLSKFNTSQLIKFLFSGIILTSTSAFAEKIQCKKDYEQVISKEITQMSTALNNGNYQFMRLLKYFIWKDERKLMEDGTIKIIESSELCNYLENSGQENNTNNDWTSNLN